MSVFIMRLELKKRDTRYLFSTKNLRNAKSFDLRDNFLGPEGEKEYYADPLDLGKNSLVAKWEKRH